MNIVDVHRGVAKRLFQACSPEKRVTILNQTADNLIFLATDTSNHIFTACKDNAGEAINKFMPQIEQEHEASLHKLGKAMREPDNEHAFVSAILGRLNLHRTHDRLIELINDFCGEDRVKVERSIFNLPPRKQEQSKETNEVRIRFLEKAIEVLHEKKEQKSYVKTFLDTYLIFSIVMLAGSLWINNAPAPILQSYMENGLYNLLLNMTHINTIIMNEIVNGSSMYSVSAIIIGFAIAVSGKKDITWRYLLMFTSLLALCSTLPVIMRTPEDMGKARYHTTSAEKVAKFRYLHKQIQLKEPGATEERSIDILMQIAGRALPRGDETYLNMNEAAVAEIIEDQKPVLNTVWGHFCAQMGSILYTVRTMPTLASFLQSKVQNMANLTDKAIANSVVGQEAAVQVFDRVVDTGASLVVWNEFTEWDENSVLVTPFDELTTVGGQVVGQSFVWGMLGYGAPKALPIISYYTGIAQSTLVVGVGTPAVAAAIIGLNVGAVLHVAQKALTGQSVTPGDYMEGLANTVGFGYDVAMSLPNDIGTSIVSTAAKGSIKGAMHVLKHVTKSRLSLAPSESYMTIREKRKSLGDNIRYNVCLGAALLVVWYPSKFTAAIERCEDMLNQDTVAVWEEAENEYKLLE